MEPQRDRKNGALTVLELTEGLGDTETGFKVFEVTDANKQQAALRIMRMFACYELILEERKGSLSRQIYTASFLQVTFRDSVHRHL
jgi:hypothetical protein